MTNMELHRVRDKISSHAGTEARFTKAFVLGLIKDLLATRKAMEDCERALRLSSKSQEHAPEIEASQMAIIQSAQCPSSYDTKSEEPEAKYAVPLDEHPPYPVKTAEQLLAEAKEHYRQSRIELGLD